VITSEGLPEDAPEPEPQPEAEPKAAPAAKKARPDGGVDADVPPAKKARKDAPAAEGGAAAGGDTEAAAGTAKPKAERVKAEAKAEKWEAGRLMRFTFEGDLPTLETGHVAVHVRTLLGGRDAGIAYVEYEQVGRQGVGVRGGGRGLGGDAVTVCAWRGLDTSAVHSP